LSAITAGCVSLVAIALAAPRAPGHEPDDDEYGHRDQPDDEEELESCEDRARSRDGKPGGEDRAEDCPDDSAHVPSMRPGPGGQTAPPASTDDLRDRRLSTAVMIHPRVSGDRNLRVRGPVSRSVIVTGLRKRAPSRRSGRPRALVRSRWSPFWIWTFCAPARRQARQTIS
jgi:hypothetical protein